MTSVDSGVDTGNDSNDSSITQHENISSCQITNVASAVATTSDAQSERKDEQGTFRIEFNSVDFSLPDSWPIEFNLPIASLCPVLENYNSADKNQGSGSSNNTGQLMIYSSNMSPVEFPLVRMYDTSNKPLLTMDMWNKGYRRKIKSSLHGLRESRQYFKEIYGKCVERKMRLAAATNNTMMIRRLLNNGVSPNNHDDRGRTPLHLAACRGYTDIVQLLLQHGADPNQRDCLGNTPLHLAAVATKISVVTLLLKAGTDVLSSDSHGYNPLQLAQTKLMMLPNCKGGDMMRVKEEVHNVIGMLLAYLQKQKDACEQVETLSTFCSRLSLSNTSDQIQDDVKDLLANIDALSIRS